MQAGAPDAAVSGGEAIRLFPYPPPLRIPWKVQAFKEDAAWCPVVQVSTVVRALPIFFQNEH